MEKAIKWTKDLITDYTVCIIMTDGEVTDKESDVQILKTAINLPISFVIIGMGDEDLSSMK